MRQLRENNTQEHSEIHGGIHPADIRPGDAVVAKLKCEVQGKLIERDCQVWRLSPLGVELLMSEEFLPAVGTSVDLDLKIAQQRSQISGLLVDKIVSFNGKFLLHIRLSTTPQPKPEAGDRRNSNRWICSDQFYPTAVASNPAQFNDFIYFKIKDISSEGFKLHTSLRNKFIIPGMNFDCIVNFPMISQVKMKIQIKNVRVEMDGGREVLALGATYSSEDKFLKETVGQYLMQFGSVSSLEELKSVGLGVEKISEAVQFKYVKTDDEYRQVLELRRVAYLEANKIDPNTKSEDLADEFDARSRIVIGIYKGQVVASARLIFNQFDDEMEQERFVQWPQHLPRRDEMVEIMRACTRPDFRGSDLLIAMFKFIAVTVVQSKRSWIVICATDSMSGLYKRIGFKDTGLNYEHTRLNNLKHNILLANVPEAMVGKTVNPIVWNIIWADVSNYLQNYDLLEIDPAMNLRMGLYRLLAPVAKFMYNRKLKKAKIKALPLNKSTKELLKSA